ncbi:helix-turn-helix domain-containing protein [Hymenobacter sp. UYP22]|uniref:helix-turn-helix domain-containing protein n=1 Tax=Hymenobacter sp. UYP22 TaxID=3156348 RepID=UPI00339985A7
MLHQGEILQETIKNSGISITRIVDELGITRPTIYRKFKEETLDYTFVKKVGDIIAHDFSNDFTSLQQTALPFSVTRVSDVVTNTGVKQPLQRVSSPPVTDTDLTKQLMTLQQKYIALLESYNELLLKVYGPR